MILRMVAAELRNRPGRSAFLLAGYAFGVSVMVVLLSVGEAMLSQARDQALLGGGDVIVVPAGISAEMLKAGGTGSLFLGIDQARFIQRQILESPRGREELGIAAASPIIDGRLVRVSRRGKELPALAAAEIPSRAAAVGARPDLLAGRWVDSDADRRWAEPSTDDLYHEIDAFHLPYGEAVGDSTWAEWHYFNIVLDQDRWLYLTFMVAGRVAIPGEWGGRLLLTLRDPVYGHRSLSRDLPDTAVHFDTLRADVTLDESAWVRQRDGVYQLLARVEGAEIALNVRPFPNRYFPPAELGGAGLVSGYTVPALAAVADGRVCLPTPDGPRCEDVRGARAYHDHNWGVWSEVSWEWGAASDDGLSLLYGVVRADESRDRPLFAYLVDDRGVRGLYRPPEIATTETERVTIDGVPLRLPVRLAFEDRRRGLAVEIEVADTHVTDMEREASRYFVQMRGVATVTEAGRAPRRLEGFFETYIDPDPDTGPGSESR